MLVVDRRTAVRVGVAVILSRPPLRAHCVGAVSARDALVQARRTPPQVAVVDAGPHWSSGVLQALRAGSPATEIVLIERVGEPLPPISLRRARVRATIVENAPPQELIDAVRTACRARPSVRLVDPAIASADGPPRRLALTLRQRQILELIASGATNREIAGELLVSTETVKKEASMIFRRLGVRNRTEATRWYAAAERPPTGEHSVHAGRAAGR